LQICYLGAEKHQLDYRGNVLAGLCSINEVFCFLLEKTIVWIRMSMDVYGYPWISMDVLDIHGYPWMSMDIQGYPWISLDINAYDVPMDIHGHPWTSMDIHGHPNWLFVKFGASQNSQLSDYT